MLLAYLLDVLDPEESVRREQKEFERLAKQPWFREAVEEGLASGEARELTPDMIHQLVAEGIESARRRKG